MECDTGPHWFDRAGKFIFIGTLHARDISKLRLHKVEKVCTFLIENLRNPSRLCRGLSVDSSRRPVELKVFQCWIVQIESTTKHLVFVIIVK